MAAKVMFFRVPKDSEALFTAADYGMDEAEVWPDNWPHWRLFVEMAGQWRRAGMNAQPVALDYTPLFMRMERLGLEGDAWENAFADVRLMESAALEQMQESTT